MNKKYASIDCGIKGGIAIWEGTELKVVAPMPINKDKSLNMVAIKNVLNNVDAVIIEEQFNPNNQKDKNGKKINNQGGRTNIMNWGMIRGVALSLGKEVIDLRASEWVTALGLSNRGRSPMLPRITKKDHVILCNSLHGTDINTRDDGLADAVLIGHYMFKKWRLV